jgi:hypothetical protein
MTTEVQVPRASQRQINGARLRKVGAVLFWIGLPGSSLAIFTRLFLPEWTPVVVSMGMAAIAFLGVSLMRRGRKLMAFSGDVLLQDDPRPPVVYLRPFAADARGADVVSSWPLLRFGYFTEEEQLAMVLNEVGPFVAIGDPRESLPALGAARIYTTDEEWQRKVADLLSRAALVILQAGTSEGFWWELRRVRESIKPERLLLLIPTRTAVYDEFRARAAEVLPHPLPDVPRGARLTGHIRAIIAFEPDWRAWALPVVRSFARSPFTMAYRSRFKLTLKPIFERLELPWSAPPIARQRMAALVISIVLAAFFGLLWLAFTLPGSLYADTRAPPALDLVPPVTERPAYDLALERFLARTAELPEARAAFSGVHDADAARALGGKLSMKGLARLSDDMLLRRTALLHRLFEQAHTPACAALLRGGSMQEFEQPFRQLSAEELEQWFDLIFEATVAELRQTPPPRQLPPAQRERDFQELFGQFTAEDARWLRSMLENPHGGTEEEACRAGRMLYAGWAGLPLPSRAALARWLVTP